MPTYDYRCESCGYAFEQFQSITARPLRTCPNCKRQRLQRLIGTGGGILFKGSGFYQTDYRSESYKKAAEAEQKAVTPSTPQTGSTKESKGTTTDAPGQKAPARPKRTSVRGK